MFSAELRYPSTSRVKQQIALPTTAHHDAPLLASATWELAWLTPTALATVDQALRRASVAEGLELL